MSATEITSPVVVEHSPVVDPATGTPTAYIAPYAQTVQAVAIWDTVTLAKSATAYRSVKIQKQALLATGSFDTAVDVTALSTMEGASGNWLVADILTPIALTTTVANRKLNAGDKLIATWTKVTTPGAMTLPKIRFSLVNGHSY